VLRRHVTMEGRGPALKALLREIQARMTTSWRLRTRYPNGEIRFLDSNFFADRIGGTLPPEILERPVREAEGLPDPVARTLGRVTTGEALQLPLPELARRTGLSIAEASRARRRLLGGAAREQ
jgi:hypothetical protein